MLRHLGYACLNSQIDGSGARTTILKYATPERLRALIRGNLDVLSRIFTFHDAHHIRLFRISSVVIPFASHPVNQLPWWQEFATPLATLGDTAPAAAMRLSFHPGQYTVFSSADPGISEAAVADLVWHSRFLDAMGMGSECKLIVHGGGAHGDKVSALGRWQERYSALPESIRRRLVVENDERVYCVRDLLTLSERCGVPVVVDTLHHHLNSGDPPLTLHGALAAARQTWRPEDGPPGIHFNSQAAGARPSAHAVDADADEFAHQLRVAPDTAFDWMLETKGNE